MRDKLGFNMTDVNTTLYILAVYIQEGKVDDRTGR